MIQIPLRNRQGSVRAYAVIDDADAALASHRWALHSAGYAYRMVDRRAIYLHREVLGLGFKDGVEADHIDRDRLNNCRANLRAGTTAANRQNVRSRTGSVSQYRGVYYDQRRQKWYAQVKTKGKRYHFGMFTTEEEAARAAEAGRKQLLPYA